jgi:hypothetical protein
VADPANNAKQAAMDTTSGLHDINIKVNALRCAIDRVSKWSRNN